MRFLLLIIVLLFAVAGIVFGALNADLVTYDVLFAQLSLPKGAVALGMLVVGWILGGLLVWLVTVQPLRLRLRRANKKLAAAHPEAEREAHAQPSAAPAALQDRRGPDSA